MLDIEKYLKQLERLNECFKNVESAKLNLDKQLKRHYSNEEDDSDIVDARDLLISTQQTLIGQLKLMNIQNKEDLES